jgi:hypothetical protein
LLEYRIYFVVTLYAQQNVVFPAGCVSIEGFNRRLCRCCNSVVKPEPLIPGRHNDDIVPFSQV